MPTSWTGRPGKGWNQAAPGRELLRGARQPAFAPRRRQSATAIRIGAWKPEHRAIDTVIRKLRHTTAPLGGDGGIKAVRGNGHVFVGFPMVPAGEEGG